MRYQEYTHKSEKTKMTQQADTSSVIEELKPPEKKMVDTQLALHSEEDRLVVRVTYLKGKKRKPEEAIVVIGTFRIYVFRNGKCAAEPHMLDLLEISLPAPDELCLKFKNDVQLNFVTKDYEQIVQQIHSMFVKCYPGMPEACHYTVVAPLERKDKSKEKNSSELQIGSCGGFVRTYKAICDYLSLPPRQDICWDVDNILHFSAVRDFNVVDYFYSKDSIPITELKPLTKSLEHNSWFTSFSSPHHKMGNEGVQAVAEILRYNTKLEKIVLRNTGCSREAGIILGDCLHLNKQSRLNYMDFGSNQFEDKGMSKIAAALKEWRCDVIHLDFTNVGMSKAGIKDLLTALTQNSKITDTIEFFSIANNKGFDLDSTRSLAEFMSKTKVLKTLNIKGTNMTWWGEVKLCPSLTTLDISHNKLSGHDINDIVKMLLPCCTNLRDLRMGGTMVPGNLIEKILHILPSLTSLDISDNDFGDDGLIDVCEALKNHKTIVELKLDRNWVHRSKSRPKAIQSLISLVTPEVSPSQHHLRILYMSGSKDNRSQMKEDIRPFLLSLMVNTALETLDISGHAMGDLGSLALSKTLQTDPPLRKLIWDDNAISIVGLRVFTIGLERNFHLSSMPIPINDLTKMMQGANAERQKEIQTLLDQIETKLRKNGQNGYDIEREGDEKINSGEADENVSSELSETTSPRTARKKPRSYAAKNHHANVPKKKTLTTTTEESQSINSSPSDNHQIQKNGVTSDGGDIAGSRQERSGSKASAGATKSESKQQIEKSSEKPSEKRTAQAPSSSTLYEPVASNVSQTMSGASPTATTTAPSNANQTTTATTTGGAKKSRPKSTDNAVSKKIAVSKKREFDTLTCNQVLTEMEKIIEETAGKTDAPEIEDLKGLLMKSDVKLSPPDNP